MEYYSEDILEELINTEVFKIRVIGEVCVGKSSLISRFNDGTFNTKQVTIGDDFVNITSYYFNNFNFKILKTLKIDGKTVKVQIVSFYIIIIKNKWDTAGQETYRSFTNTYFRFASGIYLVYDISSRISFKNLRQWVSFIKQNCEPSIQVCLIGNKSDKTQSRVITYEQGQSVAAKILGGIPFFETSAKTGENVDNAFYKLINNLHKNKLEKDNFQIFFRELFQNFPKEISQLSTAKDHLKIIGVHEDVFSGSSLAKKDENGIIHYFPAKLKSPNYFKYCDINQLYQLEEYIYIQAVKKYTEHESLYCTKVNLLLAADSNQLVNHATFINQLQTAILYYAQKGKYQVKKNSILYRGVDCSKQEIEAYKENEILYFPSFMSTSFDKDKFYQGANYNTVFIIRFQKTPNCAFQLSKEQSKYEEAEVLFKCYSKFKVEKQSRNVVINGKNFENIIELLHLNEPLPKEFQNSITKFFSNFKEQYSKPKTQNNKEIVNQKPKEENKQNEAAQNRACKIVIVGMSSVGKTSIIQRYVDNQFSSDSSARIGVAVSFKSFDQAKNQLDQINDKLQNSKDVKYLLLGNKIDLENRVVQNENGLVIQEHISLQIRNLLDKIKCYLKKSLLKQEMESKKPSQFLLKHYYRIIFLSYKTQNFQSFDESELTVDLDSLQGKATLEDMKINTNLLTNSKLTQIDKFGIAHFYPQEQLGQHYQKFFNSWQPHLANNEIISIVNQYTDKDTMLSSDSEQLSEYAKQIKQLRYSIQRLATIYPVKTKQVFRGMDSSQKEFDEYPLGKDIYLPSFTSTSKNSQKFYTNEKQNTILIINLKTAPLGAFVVTRKYSKNAENDEEVLFACYSKFKVIKKEMNYMFSEKQFKFYIELEAVEQSQFKQQQNNQSFIINAMMFSQFMGIH